MNFIQSVKTCFRTYAVFKGRATRSEFWWFVLFFTIFGVGVLSLVLFLPESQVDLITLGIELALLLPLLAVTSRRLHDRGLSGWLQIPVLFTYGESLEMIFPMPSWQDYIVFLGNIALLYWVFILFLCIKRTEESRNRYGPNPNAPDMDEVFS